MLYSPAPMHIPDGFLSTIIALIYWALSLGVLAVALRKTRQTLGEREAPLLGVLAATIFAGQMINFSVAGGTSGHLLGAALATILVGPFPAMLVMTAVLSIQALIFQDGGLLALGANVFNLAVIGPAVSYAVYVPIQRLAGGKPWGIFTGGFVAAWVSIVIAALSCALQLSLSGTSPAFIAVPAMGGIHALIGIGEGLITTGALAFLYSARRDLVRAAPEKPAGSRAVIVGGGMLALVMVVLSPLASAHPDGLEWVAEQFGFMERAQDAFISIIPDYVMPGIPDKSLAVIMAGVIGLVMVFGVTWAAARSEKKTFNQ
ncbi:MAG: energy-coupling factor ABC transporter permease [Anaerolineaceae bacterium]|nr:energy-coupling factor ABC transporter permease [Anaerolineaceae bacterium]